MTDVAEEVAGLNDTTTAGVGVLDEGLKGAGSGLAAVAEATAAGHERVAEEIAASRSASAGFAADIGTAVAQAFGPLLAPIAGLQGAKGEEGPAGPAGSTGPNGKDGRNGTNGQDGPAGPIGPTGSEGEAGRDGAPGSPGAKGDKGLNWRGAFDGRIFYQADDAIEFQGSSFVAVSPIRGVTPPGNGWDLLARRGVQGPSGAGGGGGGGVALSNAVPLVESGSGAAGTGTKASKDDHVHPADGGGGGGADDQTAAEVPFTPAGGIAATDVQAAIEEVAAEAGGELVGAAVARTIAAGVIDVAGLRYVIVEGEGAADDLLDSITGGVDGQFLVLESAGNTITIGYGTNINLANQEANTIQLGNFVMQVFAVYSVADGNWIVWSNQQPRSIMSEADGSNEVIATDTGIEFHTSNVLVAGMGAAKIGFFNKAGVADIVVQQTIDAPNATPEQIANILIAYGLAVQSP